MLKIIIILASILFFQSFSFSKEEYFLTLRYDTVNLRQGPSRDYPVKIFYKKKFLPVLIQDQSDNFRKIKDHENNTGWIHISQLSKKKAAIVIEEKSIMFRSPTVYSQPIVILDKGRLTKIIKQAELQVYNKNTGENKYELFPVEPLRGFNRLPQKGSCDLFFDIEGAPSFVYEDGLQYLFGLHYIENDKAKSKFFWAHDRDEEKQLIIDFLDFVTNHLSKYPDSYIFHYHNYEERAVKDLTSFHKVKMRELDNLLIKEKFVDLYKCVKESMQFYS